MSKQPRPSQGVLNLPIGRRLKGLMIAAARENGQKLSMACAEALIDWLAENGFYEPTPAVLRNVDDIVKIIGRAGRVDLTLYPSRELFRTQAQAAHGMTWEDHNGFMAELAWNLNDRGIAVRWITPETTDLSRLHRDGKLGGQN